MIECSSTFSYEYGDNTASNAIEKNKRPPLLDHEMDKNDNGRHYQLASTRC